MAKTTRMAFTAEELEVLYSALNSYGLEMMETSKTWGNLEAICEGRKDIWHRTADIAGRLQSRTFHAQLRMEKAKNETATEEVDG